MLYAPVRQRGGKGGRSLLALSSYNEDAICVVMLPLTGACEIWLSLRRHLETGGVKRSLCQAPGDTAVETLVRLSGLGGPIATCFEDSKQRLGREEDDVGWWSG
jgi:hypothetical protein